jgi:hypothetical protein
MITQKSNENNVGNIEKIKRQLNGDSQNLRIILTICALAWE